MAFATVGVRELRQDASRVLRRVRAGESFTVTDRGVPVANLTPMAGTSIIEELVATGQARPARRGGPGFAEIVARLQPPAPGSPSAQQMLDDIRRERI